jgi:hypothetical protein
MVKDNLTTTHLWANFLEAFLFPNLRGLIANYLQSKITCIKGNMYVGKAMEMIRFWISKQLTGYRKIRMHSHPALTTKTLSFRDSSMTNSILVTSSTHLRYRIMQTLAEARKLRRIFRYLWARSKWKLDCDFCVAWAVNLRGLWVWVAKREVRPDKRVMEAQLVRITK